MFVEKIVQWDVPRRALFAVKRAGSPEDRKSRLVQRSARELTTESLALLSRRVHSYSGNRLTLPLTSSSQNSSARQRKRSQVWLSLRLGSFPRPSVVVCIPRISTYAPARFQLHFAFTYTYSFNIICKSSCVYAKISPKKILPLVQDFR